MMKKRAKPVDCPYKDTCTQKVLQGEAEFLCKDLETDRDAVMLHMNNRHGWEMCKVYQDKKREAEGKLPREW